MRKREVHIYTKSTHEAAQRSMLFSSKAVIGNIQHLENNLYLRSYRKFIVDWLIHNHDLLSNDKVVYLLLYN